MENLKELIVIQNPHFEENFFYPYPLKRAFFGEVVKNINIPHIIAISGVRRTGKSTLLKQVINHLISNGVPRKNILYFSYDEVVENPLNIIKEWEEIISRKIRGRNYYLLLDEVQKLSNWGEKIKTLYDHLNLKIIVSGSSSLGIKKGKESLAGRVIEWELKPLAFSEFLLFSSKEKSWDNYKFYMKRQLPELALYSIDPQQYIKDLVKKVVYEDIPKLHEVESPETVEKIFSIIERHPGEIIKISNLANDLGISRITLSKYLKALEESLLIRKLYNYSKNARKVEVRDKKYYPYFTSLCAFHLYAEFPLLVETEVAFKLNAEYFWNERGKEVDFIVPLNSKVLAFEVKTGRRVTDREIRHLLRFPYKADKYLITLPETEVKIKGGVGTISLMDLEEWHF